MDAPKKLQMNLLFDLYGQLLTDRQREIFILTTTMTSGESSRTSKSAGKAHDTPAVEQAL